MRRIAILAALAAFIMLSMPVQAATTNNLPLIVRIGGESSHFLAAWNGITLQPFEDVAADVRWGNPRLAADGSYLAYTTYGQVNRRTPQQRGADVPTDVFLVPMAPPLGFGSSRRIAAQPEDATYNADGTGSYSVRTNPVWAADSMLLFWAEYSSTGDSARLVRYAVESGSLSVLADDLPLRAGDYRLGNLHWSAAGILYALQTADSTRLLIYSAEGERLHDRSLDFSAAAVWISTPQGEQIALGRGDEPPYTYTLFAPEAGTLTPFEETQAPALSAYGVDMDYSVSIHAAPTFWSVSVIGTSHSLEGFAAAAPFPSSQMALSPDGRLAAYVDGDGKLHSISQDGVLITLTGSIFGLQPEPMHAIAWSAPRWVIGSFFMR
ncbi:MAG: hypothetical protein DYG88_00405 [Chloroflexi bacterium CFX4]|nr:hypothetical protein [Chloroflexi bacterium CFX4]MDL1921640.1 hypothetical protein [Chloroflexi bacterium CFX3]